MRSTAPLIRDHALARWALIVAIVLTVASTAFEMIHFPGILTPAAAAIFYLGIFVLTIAAYGGMAIAATRATTAANALAFTQAVWWGVAVGVLWWIEILQANVWRVPGPGLAGLYYGPELAAYILPAVAAGLTARQTGHWRAGLWAGLWSGMVGGLLTFLGGTLIIWLCNASFLNDPQNMQEFLHAHAQGLAPDLQTYIVGDLLAGLIAHLAVIGIGVSAVVGAIGAAIGQATSSRDADPTPAAMPR